MARYEALRWFFEPIVSLAFPAPKIAFVPVFILWFGIDHLSKILLVAATCVFPVIVAAYQGAAHINRFTIWSANAMGTSSWQMLVRVAFPATLPYIVTGIRITIPMSLITAFTAEMVAGGGGIGAQLMYAQRFFETPTVFVYILLMAIIGLVADWLIGKLQGFFIPWQSNDARKI